MRVYRSSTGPFLERPYFKLEQIEQICTDELRQAGLYPTDPSPVRIERFIEKRFGVSATYDDLPSGLLGFTEFGDKGVKAIVIAKTLDDEGTKTAERRIRTTMAHEGGHGLLHTYLVVLGAAARPLFGDGLDPKLPRILCRTDGLPAGTTSGGKNYDGRWWEFQANQAMGALLLPKTLVHEALEPMLTASGLLGHRVLLPVRRGATVQLLADVFDVNPVVAKIRLAALYPEGHEAQLTL